MPGHLARPRLQTLQIILLVAPVLLFSVIAHEIAHGLAALRQGDRTALDAGRLSWNPARHIDPFFTILLPLMMLIGSAAAGVNGPVLGGAKPVPVDPRNYRNVRRGDIIVSLAGVATNFLIAIACALLIVLTGLLGQAVEPLRTTLGILQAMFVLGIQINAVLVAFNLLPIPPLDGSHVVKYLLPRPLAIQYVRLARYGLLVLVLLLWVGQRVLEAWLYPALLFFEWTVALVSTFVLPTATQWLR
ncbi:MAG: site-2 protease family protein [Gemmatimonadaceae bacterium]|nr:site-2 protease family protein [Gemmatimonadaceae bacterium]NUP72205.1 site-2 protease family protein [Gemmatimonadaceae bacterium]NUS34588.1 site-2 protease family protein [Gemmatimonadaceae bacterium]NUS49332.1 site-2 protease family protein [Gemmatimonadaceae bacterium]